MKALTIIGLSILFLSKCGVKNTGSEENMVSNPGAGGTKKDTVLITDDDFILTVKENLTLSEAVQKLNMEEKVISTHKNEHNTNEYDTVLSVHTQNDTFSFNKTVTNTILLNGFISDSKITISKNIVVGMYKEQFMQAINTNQNGSTYIVEDLEGSTQIIFSFTDNKLTSIRYLTSYVD